MTLKRRHALALLGSTLLLARPAMAQTREFVDSAKRKISLPAQVSRVFVAGPPASVLAYVLAREAMVGWIRQPSPAEKEFLAAPARDLPETGRLTGRGDTVSLERLVAAKPDLVLDFGSTTDTYVSLADRVQSQTGIPYVLIDGRVANTGASLKLAAEMLGRQTRGAALAAYADKTFALVDEVIARVPADKRPRVYLARGPEGLETGARGSINTEIIERAGATNVVEGIGGRGNIATASLEQIIAWQPDIIVTMDRAFFESVKSKPGWDQVRAVKEGKVFLAPSLPWGWIDAPPSLNRLIGLRWLLQTFYPAEAKLDLRADTRAFYDLFYGVAPGDAQLNRLLGEH
ncbi:MAG TPA: iron ABC transporter substrate-binding protein [Reyranella sp.]|nr:iron ABC transporter substrate-binding protein [Reyranella sp.]